MEQQAKYIEALITLHSGLQRQGPGDTQFSADILSQLPAPPPNLRIADIGCGAGVGALMLAKTYGTKVKAVDFSAEFLAQLMEQARREGLADLIDPIECDMGQLDWEPESIDLLWSEGAAYNITVEGALKAWRPFMAARGVVVISEMNYFTSDAPTKVAQYLKDLYPGIKTEAQNVELITASGFQLLGQERLPAQAWWDNYYDPLCQRIEELNNSNDEVMQAVIRETEAEMQFFRAHHLDYGYTFYIMQAV